MAGMDLESTFKENLWLNACTEFLKPTFQMILLTTMVFKFACITP